jgi:hypothetical protein
MIIYFNPDIFDIKDEHTLDIIVKIFTSILEDKHLIDTRSMTMLLDNKAFESTALAAIMSSRLKQHLAKYLLQKSGSITQLHKQHLTHFTIGLKEDEVPPYRAYNIITERSKIVIENDINDWKFLKGICEKYTNHKKRGNIYKLIKNAINNEWIESSSGGGIGQIKTMVEKWVNSPRYMGIHQYKIMAIFDSDRVAHNDFVVKDKDLVGFLKKRDKKDNYKIQLSDCVHEPSDLIIWHILHKRKIENYIPLSVLFNCIPTLTDNQKADLENLALSPENLDFHEYNYANIGLREKKIKEQFPEMFLTSFSIHDMEERCEHHKVPIKLRDGSVKEVSEMEQILLKIAKII